MVAVIANKTLEDEKLTDEKRNVFTGRENVGDGDVFSGSGDEFNSGVVAGDVNVTGGTGGETAC